MRLTILIFFLAIPQLSAVEFPPVTDFGPTNDFGARVQQSLRWMAQSSSERKRTVRVLFYGQSITAQRWSVDVAQSLRERFPFANLVVTNLAVAGFQADTLSRIAEADITGFYPDLLIFHDYGSTPDYERIIAWTRERTTADILIQNDHPLVAADMDEPVNAGEITIRSGDAWRNYVFLPEISERYGAELADVRTYWKNYLRGNRLMPQDLLVDAVHPNVQGDFVMGALVESHLRVDEEFPAEPWRDAVKEVPLDPLRENRGNELEITIPFTGNRVDLVIKSNATAAVQVRIDGRKPREFPELYAFSRASLYPGSVWPALLRIDSRAPLTNENWALVVTEVVTNGIPHIRFALHGSITGFDGEGVSTNTFVSNSGRVRIQPRDWLMLLWTSWFYPALQPLPQGHEIQWESRFFGVDEFTPRIGDPLLETTVTVAQGLANGPHTLVLSGSGTTAIDTVRIYNPRARKQPAAPPPIKIENVQVGDGRATMQVSDAGRYTVEYAVSAQGPWTPLSAPLNERTFATEVPKGQGFLRLRKID